jgi:hypothetical protein
MSSLRSEKLSQSPLVDFLWRSEKRTDGVYIASADYTSNGNKYRGEPV